MLLHLMNVNKLKTQRFPKLDKRGKYNKLYKKKYAKSLQIKGQIQIYSGH